MSEILSMLGVGVIGFLGLFLYCLGEHENGSRRSPAVSRNDTPNTTSVPASEAKRDSDSTRVCARASYMRLRARQRG